MGNTATKAIIPTDREVTFGDDEIIVSKTDPKGRITYVNKVFIAVSGYDERELLGEPHSLIRHPDMPRTVFKALWDTVGAGKEIFAYVKNMTKAGDFYWVFAHVTPTFDAGGAIVGYHSNRRTPERSALAKIEPLYAQLLAEENRPSNRRDGLVSATAKLHDILESKNIEYGEFVFSL
jgi:PAS domain S-box-containing protein